jgi:hypothetical protein
MKLLLKFYFVALFLLSATGAGAQDAEMADSFRADGKIYVVVAIILIVLAGLITYLFLLDRKISKLERMMGARNQTKPEGKTF